MNSSTCNGMLEAEAAVLRAQVASLTAERDAAVSLAWRNEQHAKCQAILARQLQESFDGMCMLHDRNMARRKSLASALEWYATAGYTAYREDGGHLARLALDHKDP